MDRVLLQIGPISIYWYSILMVVAVIIGYDLIVNYSKKLNYKTGAIMDMVLGLVISAIIGARAYYVVFNFEAYETNLIEIFQVWKGGLAIYGAILAGIAYIFYYCKKHDMLFLKTLDIFSLSLLLGQAIGRWGNFFNGEAYGGKTTYEFLHSLFIPDFIVENMYIEGFYRQPTFLYESLWCLIGVIILFFMRRKDFDPKGKQVSFYLIWYGIGRFFIEGLRSDSLYLGEFRVSQLVSIGLIIIGILIRGYLKWKENKFNNSVGGEVVERV